MTDQPASNTSSRRRFLQASALAAATAPLIVPAVHAQGAGKIKVGLIGCGGRGTGAATQAMNADSDVVLHAMGDAFKDRLEESLVAMSKNNQAKEKVKVADDHKFVGIDAYKQVLDSGVDVVVLTSPPHFRPEHIRAAVAAGKHIFTEKPMAVDAPGYRSCLESVAEAKRKKLAMVAGFCWRYNYGEREVFKRILGGQIGEVSNVYSCYNTGALWSKTRKPEWSDFEYQLRNWLYYTWLSGDHLVEQAVHSVDKLAWAFGDKQPVKAVAHGGRQVRTDAIYGNIFDHFEVVYEYPNEARGFLFTRQQQGAWSGVWDHVTGSKGKAVINSGRSRAIVGENPWKYQAEEENPMYQTEHDELFASIKNGNPINDGDRMMNSTMLAIMGRMAAYTGQVITWDQAVNSKERLGPDKYEWGPLPTPPVAMPGQTKFI